MIEFSTKARTLLSVEQCINKAKFCKSYAFSVIDWQTKPRLILSVIEGQFTQQVIIRSSAQREDSEQASMAGAFDSVHDVDSKNSGVLSEAIDTVIASYGEYVNEQDEVLIQNYLQNVTMSGVIFTHDLNTGAPYYVINYDDESGRTDTVTSGAGDTSRTLYIYRKYSEKIQSSRFTHLLNVVKEIESQSLFPSLDIEFAQVKQGDFYILQVRPLAVRTNWNRDIENHVDIILQQIQCFYTLEAQKKPRLSGEYSIYGEMPDWNPAEIVGTRPRPLAKSLYEYLITDSIWAEARAEIGYKNLSDQHLMVTFGNKVYIDVRKSLNSLLPYCVSDELSEKIINTGLNRLVEDPSLHDKIEFDVICTCGTFNTDTQVKNLVPNLTKNETQLYAGLLEDLTRSFLQNRDILIDGNLRKIDKLNELRRTLLETQENGAIHTVKILLDDCKTLGTRPFAILARLGFVGESLLRSLQDIEIFSEARTEQFKLSIGTVLTDFLKQIERVQSDESQMPNFLESYGHIRPGTYDILSFRLADHIESYLNNYKGKKHSTQGMTDFFLTAEENVAINNHLEDLNFKLSPKQLMLFIEQSIKGREYSKLVFTRNISDILELLASWGDNVGLNREELSFIHIDTLLGSLKQTHNDETENYFRLNSKENREEYVMSEGIHLPFLITRTSDLYIIPLLKSVPNYVTKKKVIAGVFFLSGHEISKFNGAGAIICIESADPGFDWIFLSPIVGLVTKYGGANSHMAIRCAELGIPAAIGCGEQIFNRVINTYRISLNCAEEKIEIY